VDGPKRPPVGQIENLIEKGTTMMTEERLEKVERELRAAKRRSRWLLVALGLGLGAMALVWASAASVPKAEAQGAADGRTVRANMFILEDENGKPRAALAALKDGPVLSLFDENGKPRAGLAVAKDGPRLGLLDENGKYRAALVVAKDGSRLSLFDETGKERAMLGVAADGPGLVLLDAAEKVIWSAP